MAKAARDRALSLEHKDLQLSKLRKEVRRLSRDVDKLTRWTEKLDTGVSAILSSRRWKIGNFLGNLIRAWSLHQREPEAVGVICQALRQFRAWKNGTRHSSGSAGGETRGGETPPGEARVAGPERRLGPDDENGIKRVQVGCGPHNLLDDWWNVDIRGFPGIDDVMDATKPWPYQDLEYVFGEHFLEHLPLDGAVEFLKHAGNSLQVGGILRLSTPNLEWVLHTHYPSADAEPEDRISGTLKVNKAFHGWGHKFLYSRQMLDYVLSEMGFAEVSFFSYGESDTPKLRNLERHGGFSVADGHPSVVIAEAKKGERPMSPSAGLISRLQNDYLRYVDERAH